MGLALEIRTELASPAQLWALARRERSPRMVMRMLAIADVMERTSGAEAAQLVGPLGSAIRDTARRGCL
jgi:hypothetical protein